MDYQPFRNIFAPNAVVYDGDDEDFNGNNDNGDNYFENNAFGVNNNAATDATSVWVFGYGSLCWYPGFQYSKCVTGYIRGYVRRFWQGNTTHRGTPEKPGRVATLVEDKEGITWGCAYKVTGDSALEYLKQRECTLGGYVTIDTKFFPRVAVENSDICGEAFPVLVYIATDKNAHWLGENSISSIAQQIVDSSGPSGHNVEYVLKLANFMKEEISEAYDEHLFCLEKSVRDILDERKIPLRSVMGAAPQRIRRDSHEEIQRPTTFEFTSRVPETRLRCLNI